MRRPLIGLFAATTLYAVILEGIKHRIEPDYTWAEVVVGTAIVLLFARWARKSRPDLTAHQVEQLIWASFFVGGAPIITWQLWPKIRAFSRFIGEEGTIAA